MVCLCIRLVTWLAWNVFNGDFMNSPQRIGGGYPEGSELISLRPSGDPTKRYRKMKQKTTELPSYGGVPGIPPQRLGASPPDLIRDMREITEQLKHMNLTDDELRDVRGVYNILGWIEQDGQYR